MKKMVQVTRRTADDPDKNYYEIFDNLENLVASLGENCPISQWAAYAVNGDKISFTWEICLWEAECFG